MDNIYSDRVRLLYPMYSSSLLIICTVGTCLMINVILKPYYTHPAAPNWVKLGALDVMYQFQAVVTIYNLVTCHIHYIYC